MLKGIIYSINSGIYTIKDTSGEFHTLPAAGVFRHKNITPLVGDVVMFEDQKYISKILERSNSFIRPKVANIDVMFIVMSNKQPEFSTYLIDKYLAIVEAKNIKPVIIATKKDLGFNPYKNDYLKMGYDFVELDNKTDDLVKILQPFLNDHTVAFMGQSGVGKTTIINALTNNNFETQSISKFANRGKHTTRIVQIIDINNARLIDTPGFSNLDVDLEPIQLAQSYKLFKEYAKLCKFKSCIHQNEPENVCNIKLKVTDGSIPQFRYENYLKILKEIKND